MPHSPFVYEIPLDYRSSAYKYFNMKFKEGTHFLRRLDQSSPAPPKCKERVDCLFCQAPVDSDDDRIRPRVRRGAREGYRLDKLMKHYRSQHKKLFPQASTTLLDMGFSRSATIGRNNQDHAEETEENESCTHHRTDGAQADRQPPRPSSSTVIHVAIAESSMEPSQHYWRCLGRHIDSAIKANATLEVFPSKERIAEEVLRQQEQRQTK
jgi:hypothetical protein